MGKLFRYYVPILILALMMIASCGNPTWNGDVESFVENGLSNIGLVGTVLDSDGSSIDYLTSNQETIIRVNMFNPNHLVPNYTLIVDDSSLYDNPPQRLDVDYRTMTLSIDPTLAAEHQTLAFTLGIYVPSLNRTYPDQTLTFRCETAPNPPQALMGGTTDNDKAMIAFQVPQEDTDADIDTVEIRWGPLGSEHTDNFAVDDALLLSPPPDGENLLGTTDTQNRYFYPSSAVTGSVCIFSVTLIDASGRRSETRSTASDLVEYSLSYNTNNADSGTAPITEVYEFGTVATIADNSGNMVRSGYLFDGWNTESDGTGTDYTPGQSVTMDAGNLALYAKWLQYTVYYQNLNAGVSTNPPAATGYAPGQTVAVPGYDPDNIVDGYYLLGWDTNSFATTVVYEPGDTFTMAAADLYLYAVWAECMGSEADLRGITDFSGDYYLTQDVALAGQWVESDFIGVTSNHFTGRFFGNGHIVSGLAISEDTTTNVGLFGYIGDTGEVHDLNVSGDVEAQSCNSVGILAGYSTGFISNCTASGTITDTGSGGNTDVGGLVGYSEDAVFTDCETTVNINVDADNVGGIVGHATHPQCSFTNCTVDGDIIGANDIGGIVGFSYLSAINQCTVNGDVDGGFRVGGIAGQCYVGDSLSDCTVNGSVSSSSGTVGGLVGLFNHSAGSISNCTVNGSVSSEDSSVSNDIGGLIGSSLGVSIDGCTVTGPVSAQEAGNVGGLIGRNISTTTTVTATISNCSVTGSQIYVHDVYSTNTGYGGLIGSNTNTTSGSLVIENCFSTKNVYINSDMVSDIGGLIGYNGCTGTGTITIRGCYSRGSVTGYHTAGGLIGESTDGGTGTVSIYRCFADGDVTGENALGGLIGRNTNGSVTECYASVDISAYGDCGGLIYSNVSGTITDCYAAGDINSVSINQGGLIHTNSGSVTSCYSSGINSGDVQFNQLLVATTQSTATCYYLSDTSSTSSTGNPRTAADLRSQASYDSSWDFTDTWNTGASINNGYPFLRYFLDTYGVIY